MWTTHITLLSVWVLSFSGVSSRSSQFTGTNKLSWTAAQAVNALSWHRGEEEKHKTSKSYFFVCWCSCRSSCNLIIWSGCKAGKKHCRYKM